MLQLKNEQLDKNWQNLSEADFLAKNIFISLSASHVGMLFKE